MSKSIHFMLSFLLALTAMGQATFSKAAGTDQCVILQSGVAKAWCPVCGMDLKMFYKTNHARLLENGVFHQYCSIRCLVVSLDSAAPDLSRIQVVDAHNEILIPVQKARYVIGSEVPGTMSGVSKLAFKSKREAKRFSHDHMGDKTVDFQAAYELAKAQLKHDNRMLTKKRESMIYPKGKMLYNKLEVSDLTFEPDASITEIKGTLLSRPNLSGLDQKQLQVLGLYIKDVILTTSEVTTAGPKMDIPRSAKCPVCGMFVYKYPQWAASLHPDGDPTPLFFDGVKDMMKFYLDPLNSKLSKSSQIQVTDYYSQSTIPGEQAFYVVGGDILGPMGKELIPFKQKDEAESFLKDHEATTLLTFQDITPEILKALAE